MKASLAQSAIITDASKIGELIDSIQKAGAKLDRMIWQGAVSAIAHLDQHGDVTLVNRLYTAMPKGSRALALAEYLLAFAKVRANDDPKNKKATPFLYAKDKDTKLEKALTTPWYDFRKEKSPDEVFDFGAMLAKLIERAEAAQANGKPVKGAESISAIRKALVSVGDDSSMGDPD